MWNGRKKRLYQRLERYNLDDFLSVYRVVQPGKMGIIPNTFKENKQFGLVSKEKKLTLNF